MNSDSDVGSRRRGSVDPFDHLAEQWMDQSDQISHLIRRSGQWLARTKQQQNPESEDWPDRIRELRSELAEHFRRQEELSRALQDACDWVEITSIRRRSGVDHEHLLRRLDLMVAKLEDSTASNDSAREALDGFGLFLDALDLHEEEESQCLHWLTARPLDFRKTPR